MPHSSVFVLFLVVAGISTVHSQRQRPCQGLKRRGWGGICFGTQDRLSPRDSCESIIYDREENGCNTDQPACCVDCDRLTNRCESGTWASSAKNCGDCPNGRVVGAPRRTKPGSGCICCKECRMRRGCKGGVNAEGIESRCVTDEDPTYNRDWCVANGGVVEPRLCFGWKCHCCKFGQDE